MSLIDVIGSVGEAPVTTDAKKAKGWSAEARAKSAEARRLAAEAKAKTYAKRVAALAKARAVKAAAKAKSKDEQPAQVKGNSVRGNEYANTVDLLKKLAAAAEDRFTKLEAELSALKAMKKDA